MERGGRDCAGPGGGGGGGDEGEGSGTIASSDATG